MAALLPPVAAHAQAAAPLATPQVRITEPITSGAMVTLKGNTPPLAQPRYDHGDASPSLATGRIKMLFRRSGAQQAALDAYLGELKDPHSPHYRKWLTPESYGAQFGIAEQDLQAVETWLRTQGFEVAAAPASRNFVEFSGTAGQVAQAFHTTLHSYVVNGQQYYSNASDPEIPLAMAPVVAGVTSLNSFHSKPQHVLGGQAQIVRDGSGVRVVPAPNAGGSQPQLTATNSANQQFLFLTPADAATIYNAPNFLNRNYTGASNVGAGVNIGVAERSNLQQADYANYRRLFLGESNPPPANIVVDGVDPGVIPGGDGVEALLDAEIAAGLAPGANIYFYTSSDSVQDGVQDAIIRALEDNTVAVLSVSFGACEAALGTAGNLALSELWQEAVAQGITPLVASGDSGSAACDQGSASGQALQGLTVSGFASTPYNVAVGGTDFDVLSNSFASYVSATNSSLLDFGTATGPISENPWNDSISNNPPGAFTTNTATQYTSSSGGTSFTVLDGTGGGASLSAVCPAGNTDVSGNCLAPLVGYAAPPFQSAINVGTAAPAGLRYLPDVSLFAASGQEHSAAWALCADSALLGGSTNSVDCSPSSPGGTFPVSGVGGTSAATPAVAGILAQVISSLGPNVRLGQANNVIYNLAARGGTGAFNDITVGNNSVPCTPGSPSCGSNGFLTGYNAGPGFDLASGLGSINIANLVTAWPTAAFTPTSTTLLVNNATSGITITHGTPVTLTTTVSPSNATGIVSITGAAGQGALSAEQFVQLTNGAGSTSVATLPGGSYTLQAYYPGDVNHSASSSSAGGQTIPVTIAPEASTPFLLVSIFDPVGGQTTNNQTSGTLTQATYGQYGFVFASPQNTAGTTSHGPASGQVTLLNNGSPAVIPPVNGVSVNPQPLNGTGTAAFALYNLAPGQYSFSANYGGDSSYLASNNSGSFPVTIAKGPTTVLVHTGNAGATTAATQTIMVEVDTDSEGNFPTGALTLAINGGNFPGTTVANGVLSNGTVRQVASFAVPSGQLVSGSTRLTAGYAGDGNYNGATAAACTYSAATTVAVSRPSRLLLLAFGGNTALCSVLFFLVPARRRQWRSLLVVLFAVGLLGTIGCGATSSNNNGGVTVSTACAR